MTGFSKNKLTIGHKVWSFSHLYREIGITKHYQDWPYVYLIPFGSKISKYPRIIHFLLASNHNNPLNLHTFIHLWRKKQIQRSSPICSLTREIFAAILIFRLPTTNCPQKKCEQYVFLCPSFLLCTSWAYLMFVTSISSGVKFLTEGNFSQWNQKELQYSVCILDTVCNFSNIV